MLVEGCVQLTCPLYCLHLWISERQGCRVFDWPVRVQTLLGLWSSGDLFVTPAWGMLGVRALSCESGWTQAGSLGVKKRLGGWRNHRAGRHSLSVCVFLIRFPLQPTMPVSRGNNPSLCVHLQARPALPSLLPCSFRPPRKANCQRRCFTGCGRFVRWGLLFLCCQFTLRIQQTQVWVRITFWNMFD